MNPLLSQVKVDLALNKKTKPNQTYGVMANILNCDIVVSEFRLQSHYYIHFQTYILEKGMNSFTHPPSAMG